jgi:hypothetical protein
MKLLAATEGCVVPARGVQSASLAKLLHTVPAKLLHTVPLHLPNAMGIPNPNELTVRG